VDTFDGVLTLFALRSERGVVERYSDASRRTCGTEPITGVVGYRHSTQFTKEFLKMLHRTLRSATVIGLISCVAGLRAETASEQLKSATIVLDEILSAPDKGYPKTCWTRPTA